MIDIDVNKTRQARVARLKAVIDSMRNNGATDNQIDHYLYTAFHSGNIDAEEYIQLSVY